MPEFIKRVLVIVLGLLIGCGCPLLLLCFTPIYLLRFIANFLKCLFRPDLGKLLAPSSCTFATDEIWTNPKNTYITSCTLQGRLTLENLRSNFTNRILRSEKKNGACLHPELLQYPSTWLGFPVWVNEVNFSVEEHIKHYDGPVTFDVFNESALHDVMGELTLRPFTRGKSIWEMYVLNDFHFEGDLEPDQPKSIMLIRIHHSMADGFSVIKLFDAIGDVDLHKWLPNVQNTPNQSFISTCFKWIIIFFKIPFDLSNMVINSDLTGPWRLPPSTLGNKYGFGVSSKISMNLIKRIRGVQQSTSTAVIFAAISGALRRIMIESGKPVPDKILMIFPTPMPDHPDEFTNHMMLGFCRLPVGTSNAVERLRSINQDLISLKKSTLPWCSFYVNILQGALYPFMTKAIMSRYPVSFASSSFIGPAPGCQFTGFPIIDAVFFQAVHLIGMACFIESCNENISIVFTINEALVSDYGASAKRFAKYVVTEFDELLTKEGKFEEGDNLIVRKL